jgi:hypothetical protein
MSNEPYDKSSPYREFCPQGRAGLALSTPLYTIHTGPLLCQRLYKVAFVKAVIISFGMVNFKWVLIFAPRISKLSATIVCYGYYTCICQTL